MQFGRPAELCKRPANEIAATFLGDSDLFTGAIRVEGERSLLLKGGVPIKVVSERLGHSTPGFTMATYQHVMS